MRHVTISDNHAIAHESYVLTDVQFEGHELHEDGSYNRGHKAGGAIYIFQGTAIIEHVEFINNDADMEGGAIALYFAQPVSVRDCVFTGNHVNDVADGDLKEGGAIYMDLSESLIIERTTFAFDPAGAQAVLQSLLDAALGQAAGEDGDEAEPEPEDRP